MEVLIGLALILAVNEWRDHKATKRWSLIEAQIKRLGRQLHYVGDLAAKLEATKGEIAAMRAAMEPTQEFITKAQTDLETIVKEYEVNGVPLGYQRSTPQFDLVEGL